MFPRGSRVPMRPMNQINWFPPPHQFVHNPMVRKGSGGLLSKFFPKQSPMNSFGGPSIQQGTGGFLSNFLSNPGSVTGMLENIQKALNVANQVGPMVQQYGPMVKNLPTLIKLYKELNSSDNEPSVANTQNKEDAKEVPVSNSKKLEQTAIKKGPSTPKLYI